jgi:hypothetical protein
MLEGPRVPGGYGRAVRPSPCLQVGRRGSIGGPPDFVSQGLAMNFRVVGRRETAAAWASHRPREALRAEVDGRFRRPIHPPFGGFRCALGVLFFGALIALDLPSSIEGHGSTVGTSSARPRGH